MLKSVVKIVKVAIGADSMKRGPKEDGKGQHVDLYA
jgi:hypothetical protein